MNAPEPQPIRLENYQPPAFRIDSISLDVDLDERETLVKSRLSVERSSDIRAAPLSLDGEDLTLDSVSVDGTPLRPDAYTVDDRSLTIPDLGATATIEIVTRCRPAENTRLEGLYVSNGTFCTQCEAEGFRRITYFTDRPDVMSVYTTTIRADRRVPVLLSNGNPVAAGSLPNGRHYATWHDPYPKPSYLFALVAGDLAKVEDRFVTASGRTVVLRIFVEHGHESRCAYALDALKRAMRWDEETFGLEYDLDQFNIVAVSDFNMGAMENKSLNVFNARFVLANPETATDDDYELIESVIAHEYFHNWTGNRVTCRDWFQLSLKEGLTVFRDQLFSADMRSEAVKRIGDVRRLRARQFPEDAGPLAHPVRPASYIEINNFYTATVYEKGAEVIRMMYSLLGADGFRKGMDLYFDRHDGEAVTCDDFVAAMSDANRFDLDQFKLWYAQAGTPELEISGAYRASERTYDLMVSQTVPPTPDRELKLPMHIPLRIGLLDAGGRDLPMRLAGDSLETSPRTRVLHVKEAWQTFRFLDVPEPPTPSLNRSFGAPVKLKSATDRGQLALLMAHDFDSFNRWEASQTYATEILLDMVRALQSGQAPALDGAFIDALSTALDDGSVAPALCAETLLLPCEDYLGGQMNTVDVEAIHAAREMLRRKIAERLSDQLYAVYRTNLSNEPYRPDAEDAARRALKNRALSYLDVAPEGTRRELVEEQYRTADNMTDRIAALALLVDRSGPERDDALAHFYERFQDDPLVIDKWFALQSRSSRADTLDIVSGLLRHPSFSLHNPNKVRALIGTFASANPLCFHAADGGGYRLLADQVLALDPINPQVAARLLPPLGRWRRMDQDRQHLMKGHLERILAAPSLSRDVYEIAKKSLS